MPQTLTYPGVYIEEVPSGVRTIVGVATSITAFLGRAPRGPVDEPVTCLGFGDFERSFGGLHADYPMSYAVAQFFQNGGGHAVVVRLYKSAAGGGGGDGGAGGGGEGEAGGGGAAPPPDKRTVGATAFDLDAEAGGAAFTLHAAGPGEWADTLRVRVERRGDKAAEDLARRWGLTKKDLFDLTIHDTATGAEERLVNLTVKESPRRIDRVLAAESATLRLLTPPGADAKPPKAHETPADENGRKKLWENDTYSAPPKVKGADSDPLDAGSYKGSPTDKTGMHALERTDLFNLLCIPPDTPGGDTEDEVYRAALPYCVKRRAMLLVDPKRAWNEASDITANNNAALTNLNLSGDAARNAALFFPHLLAPDPKRGDMVERFVPSGAVAGAIARTDARRGVWKAPAGIDVGIAGVSGLSVSLTDGENGLLNPLGVNCLRVFPLLGTVVWGARTMRGADVMADEYKYIPIRRLALYIEESLYRGTQWVVFEPNDEPLWAQIRLNVGAFMHGLFRQGAFQGRTPAEAYFVRCDRDTNPQADIDRGIVNVHVGFAPLKPAEFVVIRLQQIAGQLAAAG